MSENVLPKAYIHRRFHSLAGLWLVVYLLEHLITNSQASLFVGDYGQGFVRMVNHIHDLPYLPAIEVFLLGLPLLVHMVYGVQYLFKARFNSYAKGAHQPHLNKFARNHAFSWQRITSWVLLIGIVLHVVQMRFIDYPVKVDGGINEQYYMVRLHMDSGLYPLSCKLQFQLYNEGQIQKEKERLSTPEKINYTTIAYQPEIAEKVDKQMAAQLFANYMHALEKKPLQNNEVMAVSKSFGTATLLTVRETFKSPLMIGLYTIFVIAACFHAFNGLWTAMISWGVTLTQRSQEVMRKIAVAFTMGLALLGLSAIWLTYFVNLR